MIKQYNAWTNSLPDLSVGDTIMVQNQRGNNPLGWEKSDIVTEVHDHGQFVIDLHGSGRCTLHNRHFLCKWVPFPKPILCPHGHNPPMTMLLGLSHPTKLLHHLLHMPQPTSRPRHHHLHPRPCRKLMPHPKPYPLPSPDQMQNQANSCRTCLLVQHNTHLTMLMASQSLQTTLLGQRRHHVPCRSSRAPRPRHVLSTCMIKPSYTITMM